MAQMATSNGQDMDHERTMKYLAERIKSIRYGSVEVVIHDGKVVQIETREKRRLNTP